MIELPLIFISGILGSSHCIGMCGPFALTIGESAPSWQDNLLRQLIYSVGRIFTYTCMGAVAGFGGMRLAAYAPNFINIPAALAIIAGAFLIFQGAQAAGLLRKRSVVGSTTPCLGGTLLGSFLRGQGKLTTFLAGIFTGFLPCGLVYAFLTLAAGTADLVMGAATMVAFGVGTMPVMFATGFSSSLLTIRMRKRLFQLAAWCVILAGVVSIVRGVGFAATTPDPDPTSCPFCLSE